MLVFFCHHCCILFDQALYVAGQVAGSSVSTSPLPYGTMASHCEAISMGTRKKLSSWLTSSHDSVSNDQPPTNADDQKFTQKVVYVVMLECFKIKMTLS